MHRKPKSDMFPLYTELERKNIGELKEGQKCRNINYGK